MSKFVPQYEDETISKGGIIFFSFMILGGLFSVVGYIIKIINNNYDEKGIAVKLMLLVFLLPVFIWALVSRLKHLHDNLKNRQEILTYGQKFEGKVEKLITKKDREYQKSFIKSTKFFELDTNSYAIISLGRDQNYFELQTPPILYEPQIGETVAVYYLNGFYYIDNPRMR